MKKVYQVEIQEIWDQADGVKTFRLARPAAFDYFPGQECLISFADDRFPKQKKPMSIGSSPIESAYLEFTIKQYGPFTQALLDFEVGETLQIQGPLGKTFRFDRHLKKNIVFIAAGTGLVPFMSILRFARKMSLDNQYVLINSNSDEASILYHKELLQWRDSWPHFEYFQTLTQTIPDPWLGMSGRIDADKVLQLTQNKKDYWFFVCGPAEMVLTTRNLLLDRDIPLDHIIFDPWGIQIEK